MSSKSIQSELRSFSSYLVRQCFSRVVRGASAGSPVDLALEMTVSTLRTILEAGFSSPEPCCCSTMASLMVCRCSFGSMMLALARG